MFPNLLDQKVHYHLTCEEMGQVIGVSRNAYCKKIRSGRFSANECQAYCKFFKKSFDYLFATEFCILSIKKMTKENEVKGIKKCKR